VPARRVRAAGGPIGRYTRVAIRPKNRRQPEPETDKRMQPYMIWFIAAFALVAAELLTNTFYLLVVALGTAAGGVAALTDTGLGWQFTVAALVTVAGIAVLRTMKIGPNLRRLKTNLTLDVGQAVEVIERRPDGSLRVNYRGSQWDAELEGPFTAGSLYIREMRGSTLILSATRA
jgi:membrane protein implicated in regulation of membrane protease activity